MGYWKVEVAGHGIHNNAKPEDADALARQFVASLHAAGHEVTSATFTLLAAIESLEAT